MLTGDPGTGKSIALRLLAERLRALPDVLVGTVEHPQSRTMDFYRELGDLFSVPLASHNRWAGFVPCALKLADHITQESLPPCAHRRRGPGGTHHRALRAAHPGQQGSSIASSCSASSSPARCATARRRDPLPGALPLGSRIRRRLTLDYASRDELLACLDHLLAAAGNQSLMTSELRVTLADHAAGNYRILMNLADELLAVAADRELPRLDEKLFLEVFAQTPKPKTAAVAARKR